MPILNKDMALCISLAAKPSNIGTRFHNYLYDKLGLNYVYKAFAPADLADAVRGIRGLPIRGAAVSMPYKEAVIELLDGLEESAQAIDSVNTIVNDGGTLTGYNTDYLAVAKLLQRHQVDPTQSVYIQGSGGMGKAVVAAFRGSGFDNVTVVTRNRQAGESLAGRYGYSSTQSMPTQGADMLVNVTPLGMAGELESELAFPESLVESAHWVFDVVAFPEYTPLISAAEVAEKKLITGAEVIALQAAEQFRLYTGFEPSEELVQEASEFSRQG